MRESYQKWLNDGKSKVICQCGCDGEIIINEFWKYNGIPKYIKGHNRHSKETRQKISKTRKQMISNGLITPWNKGLTKEIDHRLKLQSEKISGENNPMYGKQHNEEFKEMMRERMSGENNHNHINNISENERNKMVERMLGEKNPMYGKHLSDERKKLSSFPGKLNPMFDVHRYGKNSPAYGKIPSPLCSYGKRCHYESSLQGKICFRSSYELKFAQYLDKNNIFWLYEIQTFNLGNTTYTPDFYLPTSNLFIEIKGYMSELVQEKINKFLDNYNEETLKILYKEDLIKLGIKVD